VEPRGLPGREIDDGDPQAIVSDVTQFLLSEITVYPPFSTLCVGKPDGVKEN
jgi:hypothetical protein